MWEGIFPKDKWFLLVLLEEQPPTIHTFFSTSPPPVFIRIPHVLVGFGPSILPLKNPSQRPFSWLLNTGDHGREPAVVEDSSYDPVQLLPPIWLL